MELPISQLSKKAGFLEGEFWGSPRSTCLSASAIDRLGRSRLSANFILRDFLFCASSAARGQSNLPEDPQAVIRAGRVLCEKLLEPILAEFGRFAITYGYQSRESIEQDLAGSAKAFSRHSSCPHQWDRGTFGDAVYTRVDILPFCVEDGHVSKRDFGLWVMHNLDIDLCMTWKRSNVFCLTVGPIPRRCWVEWGRPGLGEPKQEVLMGADYWQRVYPSLPDAERPKYGPSATKGSMRWGAMALVHKAALVELDALFTSLQHSAFQGEL